METNKSIEKALSYELASKSLPKTQYSNLPRQSLDGPSKIPDQNDELTQKLKTEKRMEKNPFDVEKISEKLICMNCSWGCPD